MMTAAATGVVQQVLAPAAMIPACGLLLLSSTSRMNTVLMRIRAFHEERLQVWAQEPQTESRADQVRALRLEGLATQTDRLLTRARLLRLTMLALFAAIGFNLLAVIGLAVRFVVEDAANILYNASMGLFILGLALMLAAMATSIVEVACILQTIRYEHDRVGRLIKSRSLSAGAALTSGSDHPSGAQL